MATNFPTSLDSFTNPSSSSTLDSPSHAAQHANINDAVEAVQAKLGVGAGTIGEWTSFTPTFDNVTVGNGTLTAEYARVNDIVFWRLELIFGSTTAFTGSVNAYFPITADAGFLGALGGSVFCEDDSGFDFFGSLFRSTASRASVRVYEVSGSYIASDAIDATTPFTWTTGDRLLIEDYYKPS